MTGWILQAVVEELNQEEAGELIQEEEERNLEGEEGEEDLA